MKFHRTLLRLLTLAGVFSFIHADEPDPSQIQISVGRLLEQGHYSRRKLDDGVSKLLLTNYLEALDYNHLFYTQKDVDGFKRKFETTLDDDILLGAAEPAQVMFNTYKKRVEDRVAKVKELLKQQYDFKSDRTVEINRQKASWPKDDAEADQIWRNRVENELLAEALSKTSKEPVQRLTKRYDQLLRSIHEMTKEDVNKTFLSTLAQTYDPHSEYLSRSELENFSINMRLSLVGIGAVLHSEEGFAKISELVVGGPAAKDGRIKVGDRISGVAQGDKDFVDTVDMKLDKVVEMIRGKKDTIVRLQVLPVSATDPSVRKIIEIKRDEVKLKDQQAKAEIIDRPMPDGTTQRLGWIILPSFYADMEKSGAAGAKSTTKDVLALINRLKQENITGLVMDLRRDGGGSLEEAVNLTGLFVKKGPVVQAKDSNGTIHVSRDRDSTIAWDGPLIVLTNRLSASASEIFAAALQDYGRAVIVGDSSTFGKGTVQTMLEIGRVMPFLGGGNEAGALKLTIQKFYRIAGGSTQLKGVLPDVKLPSPTDHPEIGEAAMKGPLPYDTVDPVPFDKWDHPLFKDDLNHRSAARVAADPEFRYIMEDTAIVNKRIDENKLVLNIDQRRAELDEDKARKEKRTAERNKAKPADEKRYTVTLDNVGSKELEPYVAEKKKDAKAEKDDGTPKKKEDAKAEKDTPAPDSPAGTPFTPEISPAADDDDADDESGGKQPLVDAIRAETLNILADLVELSRGPKTAQANPAK
jgi:carboxyl-terminal processing protease